jgi:hypothetical protein
MEVHTHTHTGRKKWTHYFWEFFMLFLAITLGFFAESWREHRWEHNKAKQYAQMLIRDLKDDTSRLNYFESIRDSQLYYLNIIAELSEKPDNELKIGDLSKGEVLLTPFQRYDATISQLKTSGDLRFFENTGIKAALGYYDWMINNYLTLYKGMSAYGGGWQSDYVFQYTLHRDEFLKKTSHLPATTNARSAGYDFFNRKEFLTIMQATAEGLKFLYVDGYPQIKSQAISLIEMLKKEYHLE